MRALALAWAVAALAGCAYYEDPSLAEGKVVEGARFRPGYGTIDSVGVLPAPDPDRYRLYLRMDNGGFQTVDTENPSFMAGQHVQITGEGRILRVSATTLSRSPK